MGFAVREVVHPSLVNVSDRNGLGWLEGFGEWIKPLRPRVERRSWRGQSPQ
jgi:hypothetical protein